MGKEIITLTDAWNYKKRIMLEYGTITEEEIRKVERQDLVIGLTIPVVIILFLIALLVV